MRAEGETVVVIVVVMKEDGVGTDGWASGGGLSWYIYRNIAVLWQQTNMHCGLNYVLVSLFLVCREAGPPPRQKTPGTKDGLHCKIVLPAG